MSAEVLFATGGLRVRESPRGPIVGFVWVESAGNGQLQRWVLKKTLGAGTASVPSYVFEPWVGAEGLPSCGGLPSWSEAVGRRMVGGNEWGQHPNEDGLWPQEGGIYVVAQSSQMLPQLTSGGPVFYPPAPIYPRHEVAESLRAAHHPERGPGGIVAGPGAAIARTIGGRPRGPTRPIAGKPIGGRPHRLDKLTTKRETPQIVVPLAWIHQWEEGEPEVGALQPGSGICGGFTEDAKGETYFEGQEMFLLEPAYLRAGTAGMVSRWSEKAAGGVSSPDELRSLIEKSWKVGCHYEVTGCNYYQGDGESPPPVAFR